MGIRRSGGGVPAGTIAPYGGGTIPAGWLACAGQAVSRAQYAALFLAVGTAFGVGDGATTFNLPDLRGRSVFGKDNMGGSAANRLTSGVGGVDGATLGAVGGGQSVTLTTSAMPSHAHSGAVSGSNAAAAGSAITAIASFVSTGSQGSGGAHANVPPGLVANYIIKI